MKLLLGSFFCFCFLSLVASAATVEAAATTEEEEQDMMIARLIQWLREGGGTFHQGLEIRNSPNNFGMFATQDIPKDELLLVVQRHQLVTSGKYEAPEGFDGTIWCPTVYNLIDELQKSEEEDEDEESSKYGPYMEYLRSQEEGQLPSHWSVAGQKLLLELLNQDNNVPHNPTNALRKDDLRPSHPIDYIEDDWKLGCNGSNNRKDQHAALMLLQRGWDELMIPVYDMMSHRNGDQWLNTKSNSVHNEKEPVMVRASKDIKAGDEIYTSYNFCTDCGNRATSGYGTPEILRDFGFVENYPQRWFLTKTVKFDLDQKEEEDEEEEEDDGTTTTTTTTFQVTWKGKKGKKPKGAKAIGWMQETLERLRYFPMDDDDVMPLGVLEGEWKVMKQYRAAVMTALTAALEDLGLAVDDNNNECNSGECAVGLKYDDLSYVHDYLDYNVDTCDTDISLNFENFTKLDKPSSLYQEIYYNKQHEPPNDNVCFSLHNIWQMCGSYRPHYHEMVVHYTARYLPNIKRVAFVGGGDSMLLHEILKYPSLELVIGLELDQMVTRSAFHHFGTQPHWDQDPKVQWWYGDASKTLLMLPKDYFNSFDMVLVDLSETVMSLSVTDGLDIFSALSLLLNEQGIFVKNELYMEQMSEIFRYAVQIHFSDVPVVCSQCLILGSNGVDFSKVALTDHGIDEFNLYVQPLDNIPDPYEYWHDFRHNDTAANICRHQFGFEQEQVASPGIVFMIDALQIMMTTTTTTKKAKKKNSLEEVAQKLTSTLEQQVSWKSLATTVTDNNNKVAHLVFQQGSIVVRYYPEHDYGAIDFHIWSAFDTQEKVQSLILSTLEAKSHQTYRIVAGGIFGLETWKQDAAEVGPKLPAHCADDNKQATTTSITPEEEEEEVTKSTTPTTSSSTSSDDHAKIVLRELFQTIVSIEKKELITIWCGASHDNCPLVDFFQKDLGYSHIVPIYYNDDCGDVNEFAETAVQDMTQCEAKIQAKLAVALEEQEEASSSKRVRAVLLDASVTYTFARIAYKVLQRNKYVLFGDRDKGESELLAWSMYPAISSKNNNNNNNNEQQDDWHRNLMERIRTEIILYEPNFATETRLEFHSGGGGGGGGGEVYEMVMTSSGDFRFTQRLLQALETMEKEYSIKPSVRDLRGGLYLYYKDWKPDPFFLPEDYDQTLPLQQYQEQGPVGYQTLFQLGPKDDDDYDDDENPPSKLGDLTEQDLINALQNAWKSTGLLKEEEEEEHKIMVHAYPLGDGFVVTCTIEGTYMSSTLLYDGRTMLNLNVYTEHEDAKLHQTIITSLLTLPTSTIALEVKLRDVQPRGYGRVVNFAYDIQKRNNNKKENGMPHWAKFVDENAPNKGVTTRERSECSRDRGCTLFQ